MSSSISILFVAMTLVNFLSLAIFGSLRHAGIPGIQRWMAANAAFIGSQILYALRDASPTFLSVIVANALFFYSLVLSYEGCRQFFRLPAVVLAPYAVLLVMMAGVFYWTYAERNIGIRIIVLSVFFFYMYASMGWIIWTRRKPGRSSYGYGFVLTVVAVALVGSAARAIAYGAGLVQQQTLLVPTAANIAFLTVGMLALPAMSSGMVMLAHDDMSVRLERWANLDGLTGALTRRAFFARLRALIEQANQAGGVFSVAIVDLDHFKSINDKHGHAVGDLALTHAGKCILASARQSDVFGRLGGEEFAILFPGLARQEAMRRLQALRGDLQASFSRSSSSAGMPPAFTFSAGVDEYRPGESLESLMLSADMALYAAKAQGRDRIVSADTLPPPG